MDARGLRRRLRCGRWLYSPAGMSSTPASLVLFGIAVAAYTLAVVAFVLHVAFRKRILGDIGMALVLIGWPIHFASIFTRALEAVSYTHL